MRWDPPDPLTRSPLRSHSHDWLCLLCQDPAPPGEDPGPTEEQPPALSPTDQRVGISAAGSEGSDAGKGIKKDLFDLFFPPPTEV